MDRFKSAFVWVAAVCIVVAPFFGIGWIESLIPSQKDTIASYQKSEGAKFLYIGKNDALSIYPWNLYRAENCMEVSDDGGIDWNVYFYRTDKQFVPKTLDDFNPIFHYDADEGRFFLKDYAYVSADGVNCFLDMAVHDGVVVYFHCRQDRNEPELTSGEVSKTGELLMEWASLYCETSGTATQYSTVSPQHRENKEEPLNPIFRFLNQYEWYYDYVNQSPQHLFRNFLEYANFSCMSYRGEMLLVASHGNRQEILFYNPRMKIVTGYSVRM